MIYSLSEIREKVKQVADRYDIKEVRLFGSYFDGVPDGGYANYDILGGWMCNSPLYYEKIGRYGIESAQQGLLEQG